MSNKKPNQSHLFMTLSLAGCLLLSSHVVHAQSYPEKPVNIIVPFSAGGGVDAMARILAEKLRDTLKQSVVVQNKPGASGMIGAQNVVNARPDGYTLLLGSAGETAINPLVYKTHMKYSPEKDLKPISLIVRVPNVLVIGPSLKEVDSIGKLIGYAKAHPGKVTYASSGTGNPQHLNGELLQTMANINMIHVPYKGASAQLADVSGGNVDLTFVSYASAMPFIQSGRVKALAITSAEKMDFAKEIPTISETPGLENYQLENWFGLFAPAGTPESIIKQISQATDTAMKDPEFTQRLRDLGSEPAAMHPDEFTDFIGQEREQYKKIIESANITIE